MGRRSASTVGAAGLLSRLWSGTGGRALSGGVAAVVALPVALVLARADALPGQRDELSGGGAWLVSPTQGAVTLIDGASRQVVGAVRAPAFRAGDDLSAVQAGSSAYLISSSAGTVSRVDGGTYEVSTPVQFGAGGSGGALQVYAGKSATYVVDGQRRTASVVDPVTLRVRQRLALTAQPGPGQSVVDDAGRLWVVDATGLNWFDQAGKHVRADGGGAGMRLVLVAGRPVLVDPEHARAGQLADDGTVKSWSCLDLRGDDEVQLIGSSTLGRVLAVIPATGTLVAAGDGGDGCGQTLDVGKPGETFGQLVESGGFVFVPNRTSGHTLVVDLAGHQVVADLDVVKAGARLELLAKDGLVFYNDLDGDKAGVFEFTGGHWTVGKGLRKFSAGKDGVNILTPSGNNAKVKPPQQPKPDKPADEPPADDPATDPPTDPAGGNPPDQNDPNDPPVIPPDDQTVLPTPPPQSQPGGAENGTLNVRVVGAGFVIASSPAPLTLPAGTQCSQPNCSWQYPDGTTAVLQVPLAPTPDVVLDTLDGCTQKSVQGANQRCSVLVSGTVSVTATFIPKPPLQVRLNVSTTGSGTVTATPAGGAPQSCSPCSLTVVAGTAVRLSAAAASGNYLSDWTTAGCAASASSCDVTVGSDTNVTVAFAPLLVLTARATGPGSVSGTGLSCGGGTCTGSFKAGDRVDLTASPGGGGAFTSWAGCSPSNSPNCSVTMTADATVTASFRALDTTPPIVTISDGAGHTITGSGSVSVDLPNFNPYTVTATATDGESQVTLIVLKRVIAFGCHENTGGGRFPTEVARSAGGPVSDTLDVRDFCNPSDSPFRHVSAQWTAFAVSEGGTSADTGTFTAGHAE